MALKAPIVGAKGNATLEESVFGVAVSTALLHEMVKAEQSWRRQGTHSTKTRGEVAGGRAKPFRQKGTGRARQGTTRASQHVGGGTTFGPQPRSYALKVNRKAYRKARCMALSLHHDAKSLGVFDGRFDEHSTKAALALLAPWRADRPLVVLVDETEDAAAYSFRNLPKTIVLTVDEMGVEALLWARSLLVSKIALERLHHVFGDRAPVPVGVAAESGDDGDTEDSEA